MNPELVLLQFDSLAAAERAMGAIRSLAAEGFLKLDDAALVRRNDDGAISVEPIGQSEVVKKTALGGVLGVFAGALVGLPVVGIVAGAGIAAKKFLETDRLDELIHTVGVELTSGTAALALSVSELADPQTVLDRLEVHREKLIRVEIPESLQAELDGVAEAD